MPVLIQPQTKHLKLRQWQWQDADRKPFAALNAAPEVMEFFPATLNRPESGAIADKCEALIAERGWGFWAAELLDSGEFIGFIGLRTPSAELPFSPCVEIGWRLAKATQSFKHPDVPEGNHLREHCLYRLPRNDWEKNVA